tara:strand:- start:1123 stop:1569 length:447 start_codon:yes stop_codon:yes gene_type:complete
LTYNWNVYKLFKNGKRAKAPFYQLRGEDEKQIRETLYSQLTTGENLKTHKWAILRADLPQERENEKEDIENQIYVTKRGKVFAKYIKQPTHDDVDNAIGGLILCAQSEWKWQWAFMEMGTSRYLSGFSPLFKSHGDANLWMDKEINNL